MRNTVVYTNFHKTPVTPLFYAYYTVLAHHYCAYLSKRNIAKFRTIRYTSIRSMWFAWIAAIHDPFVFSPFLYLSSHPSRAAHFFCPNKKIPQFPPGVAGENCEPESSPMPNGTVVTRDLLHVSHVRESRLEGCAKSQETPHGIVTPSQKGGTN